MPTPSPQSIALMQARLRIQVAPGLLLDGVAGQKTRNAIAEFWALMGHPDREPDPADRALMPGLLPGMALDPLGDPGWGYFMRMRGVPKHTPISRVVPGVPGTFVPVGVLIHHTGGPRGRMQAPFETFALGRKELSGPLCHFVVSRDGRADAITHGRAHHAGPGDKGAILRMLAARSPEAPGSDVGSGNSHFYGIEFDHSGDVAESFLAAQYHVTVQLAALYCQAWHWDPHVRVLGHREWTRRKVDPFFSMESFRADVSKYMREHPLNVRPTGDVVCPCCGTSLVSTGGADA